MPDIDIPNEVASTSFVNQTSTIATTTIYSVTSTGMYRINLYQEVHSDPTDTGTGSIVIAWTDDQSTPQTSASEINGTIGISNTVTAASAVGTSFPIRATSGSTITLAVPSYATGGPTYSIYVTVEQL